MSNAAVDDAPADTLATDESAMALLLLAGSSGGVVPLLSPAPTTAEDSPASSPDPTSVPLHVTNASQAKPLGRSEMELSTLNERPSRSRMGWIANLSLAWPSHRSDRLPTQVQLNYDSRW